MKKVSRPQWIIIAFSLALMFLGQYLIPPFMGLTSQGVAAVCVFAGVMILYCTVDVVWPTIALVLASITNGLYAATQPTQLSFGHHITVYVLLIMLMTHALNSSGFIRRLAVRFVCNKFVQKGPKYFIVAILFGTLVCGWLFDPLAVIFVMNALMEEIFSMAGYKKGDRFPRNLMLGILLIDCIGCSATPPAHTNAVLLTTQLAADYGVQFNTAAFCMYGISASFIFFLLYLAYFFLILRPDYSKLADLDLTGIKATLKPMTKRERNIALIYMLAVVIWLAPALLDFVAPGVSAWLSRMGMVFPTYICTLLYVLCRDKDGPYLDIIDGLTHGVSWPAVFVVGGCMFAGSIMTNPQFGVVAAVSNALAPLVDGLSPWILVMMLLGMVALGTNFASNSGMQMIMYSIGIPLIMSGVIKGVDAMAICAASGFATNLCIATPTAAGQAAVFTSVGWCSRKEQFLDSIPLILIGVVYVTFVAYPIANFFM